MQSLLLMSILFATIAIPLVAAHDAYPRRGLRRAVLGILAFDVIYLVACMVVYPRLG